MASAVNFEWGTIFFCIFPITITFLWAYDYNTLS